MNQTKVYDPETLSFNLPTQRRSTDTKKGKHRCAQTYRCVIIYTWLRYSSFYSL